MMTVVEHPTMEAGPEPSSPLARILAIRNFRLLWIGEGVSLLGDQFHFIALPWLVLQLTGDGVAIGTVMALAGLPRALFMLVGGALTDRFSPRRVMLLSNGVRMALALSMALLVLGDVMALWVIYLLALAFGLADAFFYPAQSSIIPRLVRRDQLQLANSITQGTAQISLFVGPVLAGTLIAVMSRGAGAEGSLTGIAAAFFINTITFLASVITLGAIRIEGEEANEGTGESVWEAIAEGLRYVWRDTVLRTIFLLIGAANLLVAGPINVGIPLIANSRLEGGAAAYGVIMSAFGAGSLLGILAAGALPRPPARVLGSVLLLVWSSMGLFLAPLGFLESTVVIAALMLAAGAANFYVVIIFTTWLQERSPEHMLGRVMSLLMFASIGLLPVSTALSGVLLEWNMTLVFGAAGATMTALVLLSMLNPLVRSMEAPVG